MNITYRDSKAGIISEISSNGVIVPFYEDYGPSLYYTDGGENINISLRSEGEEYSYQEGDVRFSMRHIVKNDELVLRVRIRNNSDTEFRPEKIGLCLGVNSYMTEHPEWNDKFFPSYLRVEKTHFVGYFMSPLENAVIVASATPIAAWELEYNRYTDEENCHFGHRIATASLLLTLDSDLPQRYPENLRGIGACEEMSWDIHLIPTQSVDNFEQVIAERFGLPVIMLDRYTVPCGERVNVNVLCKENFTLKIESPSGKITGASEFSPTEYGVYTVTATSESGKISEAKLYSRHEYSWYMRAARKNALYKPQKATTHTESWYGFFSAFLAKKHYPDAELDKMAKALFDEIMPLMYDFKSGKAIVIPWRIQNVAALVGLLVDVFESDKEVNREYLDYANNMAEMLISSQTEDGAYRNINSHYTSVIYIAKSMLELALCEKEESKTNTLYLDRYKKHYESARRAVIDLKNLKERIGTEGEHTLEDGMITCTALQLACFALTLEDEKERAPFIEAAEHLMRVHRCLEELHTPDTRMRGATLRFWEAQYDVMIRGNMMNTPHGWTSWKSYATYYLYLLTGKEEYLFDTVDTIGSCIQMIDEDENLRWAFIKDPYRRVNVLVPDFDNPVTDGYKNIPSDLNTAYRGKFEEKIVCEQYVDLISSWYRVSEDELMVGGYQLCPLYLDGYSIMVDNQGGACDNDVHEHFKCLEETLLKKAFLIYKEGKVKTVNSTYNLTKSEICVIPTEECDFLHVNCDADVLVKIKGKAYEVKKGLTMLDISMV